MGTDEMNKLLAGLSASSGAAAGTAVVVVAVLAGVAWTQFGPKTSESLTPVVAVAPEAEEPTLSPAPEAEPLAEKPPVQEAEVKVPQIAEVVPTPAFDEVRREADGMTVIAGRAAPGAEVKILQNGVEVARVTADGSGKFATLTMIPPDGKGHILSLLQTLGTQVMASADEIILAPLAAPVVVAEAKLPETTEEDAAPAVDEVVPAEPETVVAETTTTPETAAAEVAETPRPVEEEVTTAETTPAVAEQAPEVATVAAAPTIEPVPAPTADATPTAPAPAPSVASVATPAPQDTETTEVAVLKSTEEGVELLNPNAPEVMDNVALDTISYSVAGDVQLTGRAQSDARSVRVYLDNDAIVSLDVGQDGRWRGDLPNVDEGIYTLRVDEVAADGSVTSRVETPFKREAPDVLAAASAAQDGPIKAITVQKGATLWAIARERYGRGELYVRVFEANKETIRDANLIYPGQIFDLPD